MNYGLGYLPDLADYRDWLYSAPSGAPPVLPSKVDLRPQTYPTPCYDQQSANSCTANSCAAMFGFVDRKQGGLNINPSRRQIYYDARALDELESIDRGAYIRSTLKTLADKGAAPEEMFPYDVAKINEQPPANVCEAALLKQALAYLRVDINVDAMRSCLAEGYPFVVGITLYRNFYDASSYGIVPMPSGNTVGGHAMIYVGYDDSTRRFIVQNSWGGFGDNGFLYLPYDYAASENYSADCWTLRSLEEVTSPPPPAVPVISYVKYKANKGRLIVDTDIQDGLDGPVLLTVDSLVVDIEDFTDGLFTSRKHLSLSAGPHIVIAKSDVGSSLPFTFTV